MPSILYHFSKIKVSTSLCIFSTPISIPIWNTREGWIAVSMFCQKNDLPLIIEEPYQMNDFLRAVVFREDHRCQICSSLRMTKTCQLAKKIGFDSFSTTLLYSRYQNHSEIKDQCQSLIPRHQGCLSTTMIFVRAGSLVLIPPENRASIGNPIVVVFTANNNDMINQRDQKGYKDMLNMIVLATTNKNKVREFRNILERL